MDKQLLLLAAKMLDLASETFSNHGCNDLDDEVLNIITDEETLCKDIREWNGDPVEDWPENKHMIGDSTLMSYLADKFQKLAE
jgi:hypothetical protein